MSLYKFPDQTIPESQKDEEWYLSHTINFLEVTSIDDFNSQKKLISKYYRAYLGQLNEEEEKLTKVVTCPKGVDLGQDYIVYPLIRQKIEQIIGDYMLRPLKKKIYVIDKNSKSKKLDEKFGMLAEEIMREIKEDLKNEMGFEPDTENPEMELPQDVDDFFETDFRTAAESTGQALVDFLLNSKKNKDRISHILADYFIADRCHLSIDIEKNHVMLRGVHPLDALTDLDPYKDVQDDHDFFFESYWLTENEIYNKFDLTKEKRKEIKDLFSQLTANTDNGTETTYKDELKHNYTQGSWYQSDNNVGRIRVTYARWKSKKIIRVKVSESKNLGKTFYKKLPKDYKEKQKDVIERIEADVPRYVISVGDKTTLDFGIDEYRITSLDQPLECKLDVVSLVRENYTGTSQIKSIAANLYQLQNMASEILFELRYALKKAGNDRVLVYDVAQTPKDLNNGSIKNALQRVNHHIKSDQIMYINSKDKGSKNSFNQFTSLDISQTKGIKILIEGLAIIEDLADKFSGIPKERGGDIPQYQTATATEGALRGSTARNEVFMKPLDNFVSAVLERMLAKAKLHYEENEVIQYVIGDMKTKFLKLYKDFFFSDLGMYFSDAGRDLKLQQMIDSAAQMSMQSANTPEVILGLIDVMEGETGSEKKKLFQNMLDKMEEVRQENMKAEQENTQAKIQADKESKAEDSKLKREGFENNIDVAEIYAANKSFGDNLKASTAERIKAAELTVKQEENVLKAQQDEAKEKEKAEA